MPKKKNNQNNNHGSGTSQDFTNQAEGGQRRASNQNERAGSTPEINLQSLKLTEYQEDGKLVFNAAETWELAPGQKEFKEAFQTHDALILRGPAGSGKTDITAREVLGMLRDGLTDRILLSAPIDEGGEEIGFEPGNKFEKMDGHINQFLKAFAGHLGCGNFKLGEQICDALIEQGTIDVQSMGKLSGENLRRTVLIVDEAHKAKMPHLLNALKRLHHDGSKVIFCGDEAQHLSKGVSDFRAFAKTLSRDVYKNYVATINYSAADVKRHELLKLMTEEGDDIPPGLAARMKEEEFGEEKIVSMLMQHFDECAAGKKDLMADQLVRTLVHRMDNFKVLELLEQRQAMKNQGQAPKHDALEPGA